MASRPVDQRTGNTFSSTTYHGPNQTSEINQLVERKELLVNNIKIYEDNVSNIKSELDLFITTEEVSETENNDLNKLIDLMKTTVQKLILKVVVEDPNQQGHPKTVRKCRHHKGSS